MASIDNCFLKLSCFEGTGLRPEWVNYCKQVGFIFKLPLCSSGFYEFQFSCERNPWKPQRKILCVSQWLQKGWGFVKLIPCNDLNFAEAYCALLLNTQAMPLSGDLSTYIFSLPQIWKRIWPASKNICKGLHRNASSNLETWNSICKLHSLQEWFTFFFRLWPRRPQGPERK